MDKQTGTQSQFFMALIDGQITLWDVANQERYVLDDAHLQRIIAVCRGDELRDSLIDQTIKASRIFENDDRMLEWKWDMLARIFHFGTRIKLQPGESLPTQDEYEGYLEYCTSIADTMPDLDTRREGPTIALPRVAPDAMPDKDLWETLKTRKTCRDFEPSPIELSRFSQALYWSFGAIHGAIQQDLANAGLIPAGYRRAAPSAGSLQATEVYVAALHVKDLPPGLYHYRSRTHELTLVQKDVKGEHIGSLLGAQMYAKDLAFGVFFTSRFDKLWWKYPNSRAYRVALLDVGALLQTFLLVCTGLGLRTWPTGHFFDDEINHLLEIDGIKEAALFFAGAGEGSGSPFSPMARKTIFNALEKRRGFSTDMSE